MTKGQFERAAYLKMAEYMSREDYCEETCGKENRNGYKTCHNCSMLNVPSVDVQPIRRGKWIDERCEIICSECQTHFSDEILYMCYDWNNGEMSFCPKCGADMRGEENGRSS